MKSFWLATIILIRVIGSLFILVFPLEALIFSFIIDILDAYFLVFAGIKKEEYHTYDKRLDYFNYLMIFIAAINTPIFGALVILFLYRSIGYIIFEKRKDHTVFIFFPNFFENLYLAFLIIERFELNISLKSIWVILLIFVTKVFQEVYIHKFPLDIAFRVFGKNK